MQLIAMPLKSSHVTFFALILLSLGKGTVGDG